MSVHIDGIPESITRDDYRTLIESVGLTVEALASLEFRPDGIYAEVIARDENGKMIADGEDVARHRVFIKVEDD